MAFLHSILTKMFLVAAAQVRPKHHGEFRLDCNYSLLWCVGYISSLLLIPIDLQCLGIGMFFMPSSPRWLLEHGFEEESIQTLSLLRQKSVDDCSVRFEYMEILADVRYAREATSAACPNAGLFRLWAYKKMAFFTSRKMFKRLFVGALPLTFQQNMVSGARFTVCYHMLTRYGFQFVRHAFTL